MTKLDALDTLARETWVVLHEKKKGISALQLEEALEQVGAIREALRRDMTELPHDWKYYETSHKIKNQGENE